MTQKTPHHGAVRIGGHSGARLTTERRSHLQAVADPSVPATGIGVDCDVDCHYCQGPETD